MKWKAALAKFMTETKIIIGRDEEKTIRLESPGFYNVELSEPGAKVTILGAFRAKDQENTEVSVAIRHTAPNTQANTILHGVASDQAKIKFVGRILIEPKCGNINSFLTERVLLLSDEAKAECVPDLEIESDDVKCSHAASISRIPDDQLFYLMSRGISRNQAEDLIVEGFLDLEN
jgi:Fe-S cluster assembly protein SufD